ncbi:MAG: mevalonate kinase [Methanobacterium sp.]|jgi:mevalonate kinase|uniref:mevalonate kinase n=1 Tax=Methanobacterium sp. TaxID=2164 RepID=UPI00258800E1|nr:mevalonate kinase [Methanobacterium sp.]MCC7560232.1 mevalonate kinase [Methanobacterium sp.]
MTVTASAPGKAILFGEHAVVYGKPAIAVAVDKRAIVTINEGTTDDIQLKIPELDVYGSINTDTNSITQLTSSGEVEENPGTFDAGIMQYIKCALFQEELNSPLDHGLDIEVDLEIPIGGGLGSSAAITVATLAARARYQEQELSRENLARIAHQVELEVQGAASPLDTTVSTHGGLLYFTPQRGAVKIKTALKIPLVVGYTSQPGNTGILVAEVRKLRQAHPTIINPILEVMEEITNQARESITRGDQKKVGELMNINQGLLDSLGVNTVELSRLVYQARLAGAMGSKITGAGGGGSIIAYCPGKTREVLAELNSIENAFQVGISSKGVTW